MGFLQFILITAYLAAPLAVAAFTAHRARRARSRRPVVPLIVTAVSGLAIGAALTILYALAVDGRPGVGQVLVTSYFAVAALSLLKGLSWLLEHGTLRLFGLTRRPNEHPSRFYRTRFTSAFVLRALLLYAVGLPYVMAVAMVYRPKAVPRDDPYRQLGFRFEPVTFTATDGVRIDGWWIPARRPTARDGNMTETWGTKTALLCHGLGANKSNQLVLAQDLVPGGYNVLAFDFRAHGASGGQLTTFGDLERRDVLGAVRWLRQNRAKESHRIVGVGASMGAAALIAAAADPSEEGQAIEALAVYGTYDDLGSLVKSVSDYYFVPPLDWLTMNAGVPVASAHVGRRLDRFSPAREVQALWPRPILVVHGKRDRTIDFRHGQGLLDHALQPKYHFWVNEGDHNSVVADPVVSRAVLLFFESAGSII